MYRYIEKYPDSFSLWKQILDRTETSNFLNAFGSYTAFIPTNTGVTAWLATIKATSVDAADMNLLKEIVKFHLLNDTLTTSSFKDGKLPAPTMHAAIPYHRRPESKALSPAIPLTGRHW